MAGEGDAVARGIVDRLADELATMAGVPDARISRLRDRPVLGAALIGLDELGVSRLGAAERRLRREFRALA